VNLEQKIKDRSVKVGIIGLGYVGLPLAVEYAAKGFQVIGIDTDKTKVAKINRGENYISDVKDEIFQNQVKESRLSATTDYGVIKDLDIIFICVPTPFSPTKDPDISFILHATEGIAKNLRHGHLVILKSTTFPETTEKVVLPILGKTGLKVGKDFYLAFSPERIDPGREDFTTANTPVVVGGVTKECTRIAQLAIQQVITHVHPVSSPKVAEMEKLLENIFRSVNIALVNELARFCDRMGGIDLWEVIEAASTKPFGFMPFYPGPGIGGHCILVDPYYMSWKAREYDFHTNFIELAAETNEDMPFYVLGMTRRVLSDHGVAFKDAKILILGVAFKKNIDDIRNSPALKVMELILQRGGRHVKYNDPYVPKLKLKDREFVSVNLTKEELENSDVVVITTDHSAYDYDFIVKHAKAIVDTRNATKNVKNRGTKVLRLGGGQRF